MLDHRFRLDVVKNNLAKIFSRDYNYREQTTYKEDLAIITLSIICLPIYLPSGLVQIIPVTLIATLAYAVSIILKLCSELLSAFWNLVGVVMCGIISCWQYLLTVAPLVKACEILYKYQKNKYEKQAITSSDNPRSSDLIFTTHHVLTLVSVGAIVAAVVFGGPVAVGLVVGVSILSLFMYDETYYYLTLGDEKTTPPPERQEKFNDVPDCPFSWA